MREMKDSGITGIGNIPADWDVKPLKSEFNFSKGLSITKENLTENGNNVISYGQIHSKSCDGVHLTDDLIRFVDDSYLSMTNSLVPQYGFVFADTSEDMDGCGNAIYHGDDSLLFGGYHTIVLSPHTKRDNRYLAYLFRTDGWRHQLRKQLTEVKLYSVSQGALKKTYITLPSNDEQTAIADFLDAESANIDNSITRHKAIIEKLQEYRKAVITQAVTKVASKTRMKFLFDITAGATPKSGVPEFWDGDIVWITPSDFKTTDKYIVGGSKNITREGYDSCSTTLVPKGALVVSKRAPIGTVGIADTNLCANQGCLTCVPHKGMNSDFYYYVLIALGETMQSLGQGTTFMEIPYSAFANMDVPYCDYDEQTNIAECLDAQCAQIDEAITRQNKAIEKLEEYRKSVIYNAVTGKIDSRRNA